MTPLQQFEALLKAAPLSWSPMPVHSLDFWAEGLLWDDGRSWLPVRMTFEPGDGSSRCRVQGKVAKDVRDDSREFHRLLHRANAAVTFAKAIFCDEERVIIVCADLDFAARSGPDRDQLERRFSDLIRLISHEALDSAIAKGEAQRLVHLADEARAAERPMRKR
jgi:hypothetical protein